MGAGGLAVGGFINYLPTTDDAQSGFMPMIFDHGHATVPNITAAAAYGTILGFNEPDSAFPQASMTVAQAITDWALIVANKGSARLGSPVTANNMSTPGGWFDQFMSDASAPNPDFIAMHRYTSNFAAPVTAATTIITEAVANNQRWRRPIKITEFGMIGFTGSDPALWTYPTEAQAIAFIQEIVPRFRNISWLETFIWYPTTVSDAEIAQNAGVLNVILCDNHTGALTNVGKAYRDAIQTRVPLPDQAANDNAESVFAQVYCLPVNERRRRRRRNRRAA